jgi:hypothetical protein
MAKVTQYIFTYEEVVTALLKQQEIHEGLWALRVEFGLGAINVNTVEGSKEVTPAAIVAVKSLGIQEGKELNSLTVDAAVVNPRYEHLTRPSTKTKK